MEMNFASGGGSGKSMTLLWENPTPKTQMADNTTITLASDDYDYLMIFFELDTTATDFKVKCESVLKGCNTMLSNNGASSSGATVYSRTIQFNSATSLNAKYGASAIGTQAKVTANNVCVPYKIYGCKF